MASLVSRAGQYFTYVIIASKRLQASWLDEIKWLQPYIIITALMSGVVLLIDFLINYGEISLPLFIKLPAELLLGIGSYAYMAFKFKIEEMSLVNVAWAMLTKKIK